MDTVASSFAWCAWPHPSRALDSRANRRQHEGAVASAAPHGQKALDTSSNEQLMLNYRDGDVAAFSSLYRRHKGPLYRYLLRGCSNSATADELFQEVWSGIIAARERYGIDAKFTTYLYSIANNKLTDHYRRSHLRLVEQHDDLDSLSGHANPESAANDQDCVERLKQELDRLPNDQRDAFVLQEETEMTLEQIGEVVGVGRETVKSRLRYALKRLRQVLEDCL